MANCLKAVTSFSFLSSMLENTDSLIHKASYYKSATLSYMALQNNALDVTSSWQSMQQTIEHNLQNFWVSTSLTEWTIKWVEVKNTIFDDADRRESVIAVKDLYQSQIQKFKWYNFKKMEGDSIYWNVILDYVNGLESAVRVLDIVYEISKFRDLKVNLKKKLKAAKEESEKKIIETEIEWIDKIRKQAKEVLRIPFREQWWWDVAIWAIELIKDFSPSIYWKIVKDISSAETPDQINRLYNELSLYIGLEWKDRIHEWEWSKIWAMQEIMWMDNLARDIKNIYNATIDMEDAAAIWAESKHKRFVNTATWKILQFIWWVWWVETTTKVMLMYQWLKYFASLPVAMLAWWANVLSVMIDLVSLNRNFSDAKFLEDFYMTKILKSNMEKSPELFWVDYNEQQQSAVMRYIKWQKIFWMSLENIAHKAKEFYWGISRSIIKQNWVDAKSMFLSGIHSAIDIFFRWFYAKKALDATFEMYWVRSEEELDLLKRNNPNIENEIAAEQSRRFRDYTSQNSFWDRMRFWHWAWMHLAFLRWNFWFQKLQSLYRKMSSFWQQRWVEQKVNAWMSPDEARAAQYAETLADSQFREVVPTLLNILSLWIKLADVAEDEDEDEFFKDGPWQLIKWLASYAWYTSYWWASWSFFGSRIALSLTELFYEQATWSNEVDLDEWMLQRAKELFTPFKNNTLRKPLLDFAQAFYASDAYVWQNRKDDPAWLLGEMYDKIVEWYETMLSQEMLNRDPTWMFYFPESEYFGWLFNKNDFFQFELDKWEIVKYNTFLSDLSTEKRDSKKEEWITKSTWEWFDWVLNQLWSILPFSKVVRGSMYKLWVDWYENPLRKDDTSKNMASLWDSMIKNPWYRQMLVWEIPSDFDKDDYLFAYNKTTSMRNVGNKPWTIFDDKAFNYDITEQFKTYYKNTFGKEKYDSMVTSMKLLKEKDKTFDKANKDNDYFNFQTEKRNTLNAIYKDLLEEGSPFSQQIRLSLEMNETSLKYLEDAWVKKSKASKEDRGNANAYAARVHKKDIAKVNPLAREQVQDYYVATRQLDSWLEKWFVYYDNDLKEKIKVTPENKKTIAKQWSPVFLEDTDIYKWMMSIVAAESLIQEWSIWAWYALSNIVNADIVWQKWVSKRYSPEQRADKVSDVIRTGIMFKRAIDNSKSLPTDYWIKMFTNYMESNSFAYNEYLFNGKSDAEMRAVFWDKWKTVRDEALTAIVWMQKEVDQKIIDDLTKPDEWSSYNKYWNWWYSKNWKQYYKSSNEYFKTFKSRIPYDFTYKTYPNANRPSYSKSRNDYWYRWQWYNDSFKPKQYPVTSIGSTVKSFWVFANNEFSWKWYAVKKFIGWGKSFGKWKWKWKTSNVKLAQKKGPRS